MRLELDLSPDDWADYKGAPLAEMKRVGVLTPAEPVGVRHFVRQGVLVDGQLVTVVTPWVMWQAAHRALAERLGEDPVPTAVPEPAEPAELPPVLAAVQEAMAAHDKQWGLGPEHLDGTDPDEWRDSANWSRLAATEAAMTGELTWAHTLLEAVHAALVMEDPVELRQALAAVAGTASAWIKAIDGRTS
ncbi:hypothetical protein [Nonomuraea sp. NPDC023979]|uniref:hypothetical protein n=1 Tax=Nonomuraea sp. NPDC023979 TaxID=3154796 RepID=UPI0033DC9A66